jgi:sarcosine oxidase subunit gamma
VAETADLRAVARSAFHAHLHPGRRGRADGPAGLVVRERIGLALVTLIARNGSHDMLAAATRDALGLDLPTAGRWTEAGPYSALWGGPGQWLLAAQPHASDGFPARVSGLAKGLALAADQSDGRGVLELSGPRVRDVLARGIAVDLHPRAFGPGCVALTMASHVDVVLWQGDEAPTYGLAVARGFAGSLWEWLEETALQYGIDVRPPG